VGRHAPRRPDVQRRQEFPLDGRGRAFEKWLFDVDDPVRGTVDDGGFESEHNRQITWRHLFEQTSEWEGTLFGKPDAVVDVDGTAMRSVTGGGHWGGGLWIAASDLARVGHLMLNGGEWDGGQVLPKEWVQKSTTPSDGFDGYGFLRWIQLPDDRGDVEHLPAQEAFHAKLQDGLE